MGDDEHAHERDHAEDDHRDDRADLGSSLEPPAVARHFRRGEVAPLPAGVLDGRREGISDAH